MTNFPLEAVVEIGRLREESASLNAENIKQAHELLYYKRLFFGRRSEKRMPQHPEGQLFIPFGQPYIKEETPEIKPIVEEIRIEAHKRRVKKQENVSRPKRKDIPAGIERRIRVIEPEGINLNEMVKIGEDIREILQYIPGQFYVDRIIRPIYKARVQPMLFPQVCIRLRSSKVSSRKAMPGIRFLHN